MSLEIIALKRPPKLKSAIAIPASESAPEAPIATPAPKKIIPPPETRTGTKSKRLPKMRLGADGQPMYKAIGSLNGILKLKGRPAIVLEDGSKVAIAGLRDQKLLFWLLCNAERWQGLPVNWLVYPNGKGVTIVGCDLDCKSTPGRFIIRGNFRANQEPGSFSVFIGRNNPADKGFSFISIVGDFQTSDRTLVQVECEWRNKQLHLVSAIAI
jgi:hypothetical protein